MSNDMVGVVQTSETTFDVVEVLLERGKTRIDTLTDELNIAESTAYRHLATLENRGYVLKDGNHYQASLKFLTIGGYLRRRVPAYPMIKEKVDGLAAETGERAQFIVREGDKRVYLYTETGARPVQTGAYTGRRGLIHASAAGKSILANLSESRREAVIDDLEFTQVGPNTITDPDELEAELATVREQGYAMNLEESTKGVHAIGTAVRGKNEIIGALSVSGPATRLKRDRLTDGLLDVVQAASNELELHIEHAVSDEGELDI